MRNVKIAPKPPKTELAELKDYFRQRLIERLKGIKNNINDYETRDDDRSYFNLIIQIEDEAFKLLGQNKELLK